MSWYSIRAQGAGAVDVAITGPIEDSAAHAFLSAIPLTSTPSA